MKDARDDAQPGRQVAAQGASSNESQTRDAVRDAVETMRAVRERCVWSQQITHDDLVPYLLEESAELIDAIEGGSRAELREELGDLLWQVLFHAEIASRDADDPFDIGDVAAGLTTKMVRRHPHVFGDAVATTPAEVLVHWNAAKAREKSARTSVLDGVAHAMPALSLGQKLIGKAAAVGVAVDTAAVDAAAVDTAAVDTAAVDVAADAAAVDAAAAEPEPAPTSEAELGDALLALVAQARAAGWDAERALRARLRLLEDDIRAAEGSAGA